MLTNKNILLVISGGIAAYKSLELIRLLKKSGASVRCILTHGGSQFVTPLSVSALSEEPVYTDLWSLKDETEMGHIRLSREADLIVIAPASANMIAKLAHGMADDLASTTLLAANKPVMISPAMNPMMWENPATIANIETLQKRGFHIINPNDGDMACGETGTGRMPEATELFAAIDSFLNAEKPLAGMKVLITAGPTYEPIDPVRFVGNRSSGKQGQSLAKAFATLGADVTLVTGPTHLKPLPNIKTIQIETGAQMLESSQKSLPADIAIFAAAVADWTPEIYQTSKMKKGSDTAIALPLKRNADILSTLSKPSKSRPRLVIGFAAETDNIIENARAKLAAKGCDWLVANSVSASNPAFGTDENQVYFLTSGTVEEWPRASKDDIAKALAERVTDFFTAASLKDAAE